MTMEEKTGELDPVVLCGQRRRIRGVCGQRREEEKILCISGETIVRAQKLFDFLSFGVRVHFTYSGSKCLAASNSCQA